MEKRPRPFTAEKRFAEISGSTGGSISQADIDAMFD